MSHARAARLPGMLMAAAMSIIRFLQFLKNDT
jgi:hypothetical protein